MTRFQKIISSVSIVSALSLGIGGLAIASPDASAEAARAHEGHHGHKGGDLVHAALRLPSLRADQRAQIQQLVDQEKAAHAGVRAARSDLMLAVAQGVEAGRVDDAALKPKMDAVAQAALASKPTERAALEKLHAILDSAQRTELVNAIQAHHAREPQEPNGAARAERGGHEGGPWGRDLDLTPAQREQIHANMKAARDANRAGDSQAHAAMRAQHAKVLEAFKGDRFVMNEVAPVVPDAKAHGEGKMIEGIKAALPVLTPAQRATAAAKIRAHAQHDAQK